MLYCFPMSTLFDLLTLILLLWLAAWRLLGDRNGWLALANAWAWWLFTASIPIGSTALWRRSRLAALVWASGGGSALAEGKWVDADRAG